MLKIEKQDSEGVHNSNLRHVKVVLSWYIAPSPHPMQRSGKRIENILHKRNTRSSLLNSITFYLMNIEKVGLKKEKKIKIRKNIIKEKEKSTH